MARNIKGITIEINGDATPLSKALQGVNKDLKNTQSALKDVNSLLKMDPGNVDLLRQKQEYLKKATEDTKEKLEQEKAALEQMKNTEGFDKNSEQAKALERQIIADEQALESLTKESKEFGSVGAQQFKLVGEKCKEVGDKMTSIGTGLTTHVSAPIAAVGAASIAAFKEVDAGMDIVIQKTGATGEALEGMQRTVENLATSIPTDFETAGNAVGEVNTRFGVTGDTLERLSGQFIKFAEINGTDVVSSVDDAQKALSAFGLDASSAGDLLDRLTLVGQQTGVGMDSLLNGLIQNGTAFQEMGLSIDQATIFMGQMEKSGANSETVMQGLRKALKSAAEDGVPLNQALAELQETIISGADGMDGLTAAYDLFGKSGDQIYAAVKNGTLDFNALGIAVDDAGNVLNDTFENTKDPIDDVTTAMNQAKIAGADLGNAIQTAAAPVLTQLADILKDLTEKFRSLTPEQQQTIVKIGAIVAAVGPAIAVIGGLVSGIGTVISVLGTIIGVLGGPLTLAIGAVIAIGVLLVKNWDKIKEAAGKVKDWVSEKWNGLKENVGNAASALKEKVTNHFQNMRDQAQTATTFLKEKVIGRFAEMQRETVKKQLEMGKKVIESFGNIKEKAGEKFGAMKEVISEKIEAAKEAVHNTIEKIKGFFNFEWKLPHLKMPHFSVSGSINPIDWFTQGVPHISVDWYKKAYDNPVMFTKPTVLQTPNGYKGFGDGHGAEIVMSLNKLREVAGGQNIQINVYGSAGQDVNELAEAIEEKLVAMQKQRTAVWA